MKIKGTHFSSYTYKQTVKKNDLNIKIERRKQEHDRSISKTQMTIGNYDPDMALLCMILYKQGVEKK